MESDNDQDVQENIEDRQEQELQQTHKECNRQMRKNLTVQIIVDAHVLYDVLA